MDDTLPPTFRVDNAKSQMSVCKCCDKVIAYQALRVGVKDINECRSGTMKGMMSGWNHVDCFFRRSPYRWWLQDYDTDRVQQWVQGFNTLSADDKSIISKHMSNLRKNRVTNPLPDDPDWEHYTEERDTTLIAQLTQRPKKRSNVQGAISGAGTETGSVGLSKNGAGSGKTRNSDDEDWCPKKKSRKDERPEKSFKDAPSTSQSSNKKTSKERSEESETADGVRVESLNILNDKVVTFSWSRQKGFRVTILSALTSQKTRKSPRQKLISVDRDCGISLSPSEWHDLLDHPNITTINKLIGQDDSPLTEDEKEKLGMDIASSQRSTRKTRQQRSRKSSPLSLSDSVRVRVVTIPRQRLVDIRKYDGDHGTKRGISLDMDEWKALTGKLAQFADMEQSILE